MRLYPLLFTFILLFTACAQEATPTTTPAPSREIIPTEPAPTSQPTLPVVSPTPSGEIATIELTSTAQPTSVPISEQQRIDNLVAFTRLFGYMRYFHPSDLAIEADWEKFAIHHIESVESIGSSDALAAHLQAIFEPYAPTLRVYVAGESAELPYELVLSTMSEPISVTMRVNTGYRAGHDAYRSREHNSWEPLRLREPVINGTLPQTGTLPLHEVGVRPLDMTQVWVEALDYWNTPVTLPILAPHERYEAMLGSGVAASFPLALYADAEGTLPYTDGLPFLPSVMMDERAERLATVAIVWNTFEHFYPYWHLLDVDWESVLVASLRGVDSAEDDRQFAELLQRMTASTHDGHMNIAHPVLQQATQHPPFQWEFVEDQLVLTSVSKVVDWGSAGDHIVAINGEPIEQIIARYSLRIAQQGQYGRYILRSALMNDLSHAPSPATLELRSFDSGELYSVTLNDFRPSWPDVTPDRVEPRPARLAEIAPGIWYVDLTRYRNEFSIEEIGPIIENANGIIVDIRGYPDVAAAPLLAHITNETLYSAPFEVPFSYRPHAENLVYPDKPNRPWFVPTAPRLTENIVFLTNGNGAVSYAESFLGIVDDYQLGEIIGEPTAGTNGNTFNQALPGSFRMLWTPMHVPKADGSPLFGVGILPTIPVERTIAGVAAGRDELLEVAFEHVSGLPASAIEISEP